MACVVLVVTTLLGGGCGTIANLASPHVDGAVYGGARYDIDTINHITGGESSGGAGGYSSGGSLIAMIGFALMALPAADLVLSLIGDTLTLPYTLRQEKP